MARTSWWIVSAVLWLALSVQASGQKPTPSPPSPGSPSENNGVTETSPSADPFGALEYEPKAKDAAAKDTEPKKKGLRFAPIQGFTGNTPLPPMKPFAPPAQADRRANLNGDFQNVQPQFGGNQFGGNQFGGNQFQVGPAPQPPIYLPGYNTSRPYGYPQYGYVYGYGYPVYGYGYGYPNYGHSHGHGYGHGVIRPGVSRPSVARPGRGSGSTVGGSNFFGKPHASQYFGPPHASQGR